MTSDWGGGGKGLAKSDQIWHGWGSKNWKNRLKIVGKSYVDGPYVESKWNIKNLFKNLQVIQNKPENKP